MNRNIVRHRGYWVDGLLVGAITIGSVCSSLAVTFVDWGGDYVTESQVFVNTEATAEHYRTYDPTPSQGYNTLRGQVLSYNGGIQELTPAAGYQAPVGKSSSFWGGWTASAGTGPGIPGGVSGNEAHPIDKECPPWVGRQGSMSSNWNDGLGTACGEIPLHHHLVGERAADPGHGHADDDGPSGEYIEA